MFFLVLVRIPWSYRRTEIRHAAFSRLCPCCQRGHLAAPTETKCHTIPPPFSRSFFPLLPPQEVLSPPFPSSKSAWFLVLPEFFIYIRNQLPILTESFWKCAQIGLSFRYWSVKTHILLLHWLNIAFSAFGSENVFKHLLFSYFSMKEAWKMVWGSPVHIIIASPWKNTFWKMPKGAAQKYP